MNDLERLIRSIRKVGRRNPVTYIQLSEIIRMLFGLIKSMVQNDNQCEFSFKFEVAEAFTFVCPAALKFTSMEHQQVNAPTLSVTLNTNMAQFDNLVITPDAIGLVIMKGIYL